MRYSSWSEKKDMAHTYSIPRRKARWGLSLRVSGPQGFVVRSTWLQLAYMSYEYHFKKPCIIFQ